MRRIIPATIATIAAVGVAAALAVTAVGSGAASAQEEPSPPQPRAEFVCANLDQIQALQADHTTLISDRLALLGEARAAAEAAGDAEAVERIDRRTARVTERQGKVAERTERLVTFAAEHCG